MPPVNCQRNGVVTRAQYGVGQRPARLVITSGIALRTLTLNGDRLCRRTPVTRLNRKAEAAVSVGVPLRVRREASIPLARVPLVTVMYASTVD